MSTVDEVGLENVPDFIKKQAQEAMSIASKPQEQEAAADPALKVEEEPPAKPAPEEVVDPATVATEEMTKEQRYRVLIGMQQAEARKRREEKAAYEAEIAALKAQQAAKPTAEPTATQEAPTELVERLVEAFGQQNLQDLDTFLRSRGYVKSDDLKTVKDEMSRVSQTAQSSAQDAFYREMDRLTDGQWQTVNKQPWFIEAMNQEEGNTGMSRLEFAKKFLAERNAPKLAWYFTELKPPTPEEKPKKLDKNKLASPPATTGSARGGNDDDEVPFVKTSELERFSRDVITGRYAGREAEMKAVEARIHAAQRAGRIVQG